MPPLNTRRPTAVAAPPAATWATAAWTAASSLGLKWQAWVDQRGERAAASGRVSEANRLRHVARGFLSNDPRFAADLFAAADRHDRAA